jgi:hypothetical protein
MGQSVQQILEQLQKAVAAKRKEKGWVKPKPTPPNRKKRPAKKALDVVKKHLIDYLGFIKDKNYKDEVESEIGPALLELEEALRNRTQLQRKLFFGQFRRDQK